MWMKRLIAATAAIAMLSAFGGCGSNGLERHTVLIAYYCSVHLLFQIFPGIIPRLQLLSTAARISGFIWYFLAHDYSCNSSGRPSGSWKKVIFLLV